MIQVRKSVAQDCLYLSDKLRGEDVAEIRAASGLKPLAALELGLLSGQCLTVLLDSEPIAMFGVTPSGFNNIGVVWLLASDKLRLVRREFLTQTSVWLARFHEKYPVLLNCVDERNTTHIRWLKWAGAVFVARHPTFGVDQIPFLEFIIQKDNHV